MNPLNKTAVITPTVRQEAESKNPATPSPVVIQSSLASRIPTHQVSPDSPRSLSSYAVTPIAEDSTEAKASSSSSSSSPSRIISSASSSSSPLVETHQRVQIHQEELIGLHHRSRISEEEKAAVCRELQGRMSEVINAAATTNPAQPAVQMLTLSLLARLTANSDVRAAEFWATLGAAGRAAVVATATNPTTLAEPSVLAVLAVLAELAVAQKALNLLTHLTADSDDRAAQLWTTLGDAGRAAVAAAATSTADSADSAVAMEALNLLSHLTADSGVRAAQLWTTWGAAGRAAIAAAATNPAKPAVAMQALSLLGYLTANSNVIAADLWATLGAAGRAAVVAAATNLEQPAMAKQALFLLANLAANYVDRQAELWATLGAAGRAAVVAAATNLEQPAMARQALFLLIDLVINSEVRKAELWDILGNVGRAAVLTAATNPAVADKALHLLAHLAANSEVRKAELWATLGNVGRAAVLTAATSSAQPAVANKALELLTHLTVNSYVRKTELWATLRAAGGEGLIIAATTAGEPEVASMAIAQPLLAQLWVATQRPAVRQETIDFLCQQILGNAHRTSQALNALNALNATMPAIPMRHTIATLGQWGELVSHHQPERLALLTGIVQANTSPKKMAVCIAAVMNGIGIRQRPQERREALRNQLLLIPLATGNDPALYRQHIRLGFDAACGNTSAVLVSPVLSAPEKLQLLEILYSSEKFLSAQVAQEELSKVRLTPNISRDFKLQTIGLILNHGQATRTQFKEILTWLKGEFETDTYTVFTNPATLGDIGDSAIYALATQRDQYFSLYQNFRPHMTHAFIQAEIAEISQQVLTKEIPEDFGATLIFQLRQFLSTAKIDAGVSDDGQYDRKSESK